MMHITLILCAFLSSVASETAGITQAPAWQSQRPCAQKCFYGGVYAGPDRLAEAIGCENDPSENECICRPDLQASADAFLQSCVYSTCTRNTLDTNSAVSIYDSYCTEAGFNRETPSTTTPDSSTTLSSSRSQSQQTSYTASQTSSLGSSNSVEDSSSQTSSDQTRVSAPTDSSSNGSTSRGGDKLGTGEVVGIVVGVLGFIATAIGTWFTYKAIASKKTATLSTAHVDNVQSSYR
ncbi:hypothetical protein F4802DRAFT_440887 [Xylaria palmicola]|nr:hypothetical protein F4802DRAFT_440887 [Xylaria palmicola]